MKLNRTLDSPEQGRSVHQNIFETVRNRRLEFWDEHVKNEHFNIKIGYFLCKSNNFNRSAHVIRKKSLIIYDHRWKAPFNEKKIYKPDLSKTRNFKRHFWTKRLPHDLLTPKINLFLSEINLFSSKSSRFRWKPKFWAGIFQ